MAFHGSRPAHRSHPPRGEARARQDNRPHAVGAQRRRRYLYLDATPRTGHGDAVGQSAARRLCLRTPPARHLLHQDGYGPVDSADPRCRCGRSTTSACTASHASPTAAGPHARLACPYHSWTYDLDGNLVGIPGKEGFPETRSGPAKLTELPAAECAGFLWISLDRDTTLDIPAFLGPLSDELESWGIGRWSPLGEKVLDCPINWKLAIDTFAENYHFATVHKARSRQSRAATARLRFFGPQRNSRSREHSRGAVGSAAQHGGHLCAVPEHRVVVHDRQWGTVPRLSDRCAGPVDHRTSELNPVGFVRRVGGRGAAAVFDYAHGTVRDEDYALVAELQANLASGARERLVFGRNEPGQHRHQTWQEAISRRT